MAATKKAAARASAPAANIVKFHGVDLQVPSKLPMSYGLRFGRVLSDDGGLGDAVELLTLILGADQVDAVIAVLDKKKVTGSALQPVFDLLLEIEKTTSGEGK